MHRPKKNKRLGKGAKKFKIAEKLQSAYQSLQIKERGQYLAEKRKPSKKQIPAKIQRPRKLKRIIFSRELKRLIVRKRIIFSRGSSEKD